MTLIKVAPPLPQEVDLTTTYEAVIVGSGAAGGMAAHVLTDLGCKVLLAIGVQVQGRPAPEVAHELAALPQVFVAHLVTGAHAVEILVALHDLDELEAFLLRDLAKIRGIGTLAAGIAAQVIKYDFDRAAITM